MEGEVLLRAVNIKKRVGDYEILKGINLEVKRGEFLSIVGASGSGKSTLLYILGLLDKPTEGRVFLEGEEVNFQDERRLSYLRNRKIGFVFQFHYLIPELTALENVMAPLLKAGIDKRVAEEKAYGILKSLGLEGKEGRKPYQLSGGEQQRVAIARAIVGEPSVILADEPTGNLDSWNTQRVMEIFKAFNGEGITIIMVTHEKELARQTDRIVEMRDGTLLKA